MFKLFVLVGTILACASAAPSAEKPVENVATHVKNMLKLKHQNSETGPLSSNIFDNHPMMMFLGAINGKNIYYEMVNRTQAAARSECQAMGMQLLRFDTVTEMEFVNERTVGYDYLWIDGSLYLAQSSFRWYSSSAINVPGAPMATFGHSLTLEKNPTRLCGRNYLDARFYLCYL